MVRLLKRSETSNISTRSDEAVPVDVVDVSKRRYEKHGRCHVLAIRKNFLPSAAKHDDGIHALALGRYVVDIGDCELLLVMGP